MKGRESRGRKRREGRRKGREGRRRKRRRVEGREGEDRAKALKEGREGGGREATKERDRLIAPQEGSREEVGDHCPPSPPFPPPPVHLRRHVVPPSSSSPSASVFLVQRLAQCHATRPALFSFAKGATKKGTRLASAANIIVRQQPGAGEPPWETWTYLGRRDAAAATASPP